MWRYLSALMLLVASIAYAAEPAGIIEKYEGKILLHDDGAVRGTDIKENGAPVHVGDSVRTKGDSRAFIRFNDGSRVVLTENSSLTVSGIDKSNVDSGRVLFEIRKRGEAKGLEITSATVTMGVKGTRFAVDNEDDRVSIFLKEGRLQITSLEEAFKRRKGGLKDDFDTMRKEMERDFTSTSSRMKAEFEEAQQQMLDGDIEYISDFLMDSGSAVSISDGELTDLDIPEDMDGDFDLLDTF